MNLVFIDIGTRRKENVATLLGKGQSFIPELLIIWMFSAAPSCRSASSSLCRQVAVTRVAVSLCCWLREAENEKFPSPTSNIDPGKDMCDPKAGDGKPKWSTFHCIDASAFTVWSPNEWVAEWSPLNLSNMVYCVGLSTFFSCQSYKGLKKEILY